jgi:protein gp37
MGDLFHWRVDEWQSTSVLDCCQTHRQHTWLILTKRAGRMRYVLQMDANRARFGGAAWAGCPVWFGVSCESHPYAWERISDLAAIESVPCRWASFEPLLGPIDLDECCRGSGRTLGQSIRWAVIGCESGPGAAPCEIGWVRSLVRQCRRYGIMVYVKQLRVDGRISHNPAEWPEDLRARELPWGRAR